MNARVSAAVGRPLPRGPVLSLREVQYLVETAETVYLNDTGADRADNLLPLLRRIREVCWSESGRRRKSPSGRK